jgi:hypothetical protein
VGQLSNRIESSEFSELERGFFAAAPPEIAVQPPPAMTFDDLDVGLGRPPRRSVSRKVRAPSRKATKVTAVARDHDDDRPSVLARATARVAAVVGPAAARAWSWTSAGTRLLAPVLRVARARLEPGLRTLITRVAGDLPERPDGKTVAAAVAALVVVCGLSASVLGSRSNPRLATAELAVAAPAEAPAPPPPAAAPEPTVTPSASRRVIGAPIEVLVEPPHHHTTRRMAVRGPVPHAPVVRAPVVHTPAAHTPAARTPGAHTPVLQAPVASAPALQAPVVRAPAAHPPVVQAPATRAPATRGPAAPARWPVKGH